MSLTSNSRTAAIGGFGSSDTEQLQLLLEILGWNVILVDSVEAVGAPCIRLVIFEADSYSIEYVVAATRRNSHIHMIIISTRIAKANVIATGSGPLIHFVAPPLELEEIEKLVELAN